MMGFKLFFYIQNLHRKFDDLLKKKPLKVICVYLLTYFGTGILTMIALLYEPIAIPFILILYCLPLYFLIYYGLRILVWLKVKYLTK